MEEVGNTKRRKWKPSKP